MNWKLAHLSWWGLESLDSCIESVTFTVMSPLAFLLCITIVITITIIIIKIIIIIIKIIMF